MNSGISIAEAIPDIRSELIESGIQITELSVNIRQLKAYEPPGYGMAGKKFQLAAELKKPCFFKLIIQIIGNGYSNFYN